MQYILTEEEYENLIDKSEVDKRDKALEWVRKRFGKKDCHVDSMTDSYCIGCPLHTDDYKMTEDEKNQLPTNEISRIVCKHPRYCGK